MLGPWVSTQEALAVNPAISQSHICFLCVREHVCVCVSLYLGHLCSVCVCMCVSDCMHVVCMPALAACVVGMK